MHSTPLMDSADVKLDFSDRDSVISESDPEGLGWDLVLVFPLRENRKPPKTCFEKVFCIENEDKEDDKYDKVYFQKILMGLKEHADSIEEDPSKRIFHTERCYLTGAHKKEDEASMTKSLGLENGGSSKIKRRASVKAKEEKDALIRVRKKILADEYEQVFGTPDHVGQQKWSEEMVKVIVRRLQLACGLETYMFYSADGDEVICKVRADMVDLMIEADRTDYIMQVENQPFHPQHEHKEKEFGKRWEDHKEDLSSRMKWDHTVGYEEATTLAKKLIQETCDPDELDRPQLDPNLFGTNLHPSLHPKILKFAASVGHRGDEVYSKEAAKMNAESWFTEERLFNGKVELLDKWTPGWSAQSCVSPYAEYKIEPKFQPLYRKHLVNETGTKYTLFRQVDRIRLVSSIIGRNLNLDQLVHTGIVKAALWLHDPFTYRDLRDNWALKFWPINVTRGQPIALIRDYYGEKTALYFAWLQYYTRFLIPIGILGIAILILTELGGDGVRGISLVAYGAVVSIWATLFLEVWKRKNSELNLLWGTHNAKAEERERPDFVGKSRVNPVTDEAEVYHVRFWWYQRRIMVSAAMLGVFVMCVIAAVVGIFLFKYARRNDEYSVYYVGLVNAVQIGFFNSVYRKVAQKLNDWENHRTPTEYENNLTVKVFIFQFVNSFITFFYISFVKTWIEGCADNPTCDLAEENAPLVEGQSGYDEDACQSCLYELQIQLLTIFLSRLIVSNALEIGIPYAKYRLALYLELQNYSKSQSSATNAVTEGLGQGVDAVTNIGMRFDYEQAEREAKFNKYEELEAFDDYNEIVLQFGFVALFVVGFPIIPFLALINNIAEMHIDGYKLTSTTRRPYPVRSSNIGSWYFFLDLMSLISVMTNIGIIIFTSPLFEDLEWTTRFIMFLFAEHFLLLLKFVISNAVPDENGFITILRLRHDNIKQKVFLGLEEDDNSKFEEAEEKLHLEIHKSTAKAVNIFDEAVAKTGQALRDATSIGGDTSNSYGSGV